MFESAYNYISSSDSHMMKNTEWGAVAYLSHSKYGINKEININNNSNFLTGYSATELTDQSSYPGISGTTEDKTLPWNTETSYKASTTGNISGVYDMSGGTQEYMATRRIGERYGESGFTTESISQYENKYFDFYDSNISGANYKYRILGDATGEMGPFYVYYEINDRAYTHNSWYADFSNSLEWSAPWYLRGGGYNEGVLSGVFYFDRNSGASSAWYTFRLVLSDHARN